MITAVATTYELASAISAAKGGDTILLAPGSYSALALSNLHFATPITIASQDQSQQAILSGLTVNKSSGIKFENLEIEFGGAAAAAAVTVAGSQNVEFSRLHVHGSLDGDPRNDGNGLLLRDSANIVLSNSEFEQLTTAVSHLNVNSLVVINSRFHDLRMDGIRGGGSSNVVISGNSFRDFHTANGDHPDAIQFWTVNTTSSARNILIENNEFHRGDGDVAQGIFIQDSGNTLPYLELVVRGNLISGGMYNGIYVQGVRGAKIEDNIVQGFMDMKSYIRLISAHDVELSGNLANVYLVAADSTGIVQSKNAVVGLASDSGATITAFWESRTLAEPESDVPSLTGDSGPNTIAGDVGPDTIDGGGGADVLTGGAGNDVYISDPSDKIVELVGGGVDTVKTASYATLPANVENLELVGLASAGAGNALNNVLSGSPSNNSLLGRGGADTINGGAGLDTINGGPGADRLAGGSGADVFVFVRGDGNDVIVDFGTGDALDLKDYSLSGLTPVLTDGTAGLTISFSNGDSITLQGVHLPNEQATADGYIL